MRYRYFYGLILSFLNHSIMKRKKIAAILLLLVAQRTNMQAQYVSPDSLHKTIAITKEDTVRVDAMNWLAFRHFQNTQYDSSQYWADKAYSRSKELNYNSGICFAFINYGNIASINDENEKMIYYSNKAIEVMQNNGNKGYLGVVYSNLALNYATSGKYEEAYRCLYKSLQLQKSADFKFGLAHCYLIFGITHLYTGDTDNGFKSIDQAISLYKELKENFLLSASYTTRGDQNLLLGNSKAAHDDFIAASQAGAQFPENSWANAAYHWSLADLAKHRGDSIKLKKNGGLSNDFYKNAEADYKTALKFFSMVDTLSLCELLNDLGTLYISTNNYIDARNKILQCKKIATIKNFKSVLSHSYNSLSLLDSLTGNFSGAYTNYKKHVLYKDSIAYEYNLIKAKRYKIELEVEQKNDEIKLLTAEKKLNKLIFSKQKQQKNFALAGLVVFVIAGSYGFLHFRKKRKLQGRQELLRQQHQISRDLHDEIGATLSGIAMYSHMVKDNLQHNKQEDAMSAAAIIQQSAADMVTKLNDIVWLIKPQNESLKELAEKLKNYMLDMCLAGNIQPEIKLNEAAAGIKPPLEARKNIYLICKEAINNAVKYSGASFLCLSIYMEEKTLKIVIADNGTGFDSQTIKKGNGLENIEQRAAEMNAGLSIVTTPGSGCIITITTKITQQGIV